MKIIENRQKENNGEEKWYARMNEIEALWRTKTAECRLEYLDDYVQVTQKRPEPDFPRE